MILIDTIRKQIDARLDELRPIVQEVAGLEAASQRPGSTAGDVAKALGLKPNSVSTQLTQLAKAGAIAKAPRGYPAT